MSNHGPFLRQVALEFTGQDVLLRQQRLGSPFDYSRSLMSLGSVYLAEVAAGDEAIYIYFGHEPEEAPIPLDRFWDRIQLQGSARLDFLRPGQEPSFDFGVMPLPKKRRG